MDALGRPRSQQLAKVREIVEILGPAGNFLVSNQGSKTEEVEWRSAFVRFDEHRNPCVPSLRKCDAVDSVQQIDPVWRAPKLDDNAFLQEFIDALETRDGAAPEREKDLIERLSIVCGSVIEKIDVTGQSDVSVMNDGLTTHDHVSNLITVQERDKFAYIE